ncbi:hypothetical protein C8Q75DRAFT_803651 [Abortiporus biennis]|nr:hypothetical protein C8Q75DRAFT_803651 [Abortiporus biennis]
MTHSVITFPPPPPTTNMLSSIEKAKLLRSTAKLGHVLGTTPHVLDDGYTFPPSVRIEIPSFDDEKASFKLQRKGPTRNFFKRSNTSSTDLAGTDEESDGSLCSPISTSSLSSSSSCYSSSDSDASHNSPRSSISSRSSSKSLPLSRARVSSFSNHRRAMSLDSTHRGNNQNLASNESSWRSNQFSSSLARRPPLLKLALTTPVITTKKEGKRPGRRPKLDTIPGSPPWDVTSYDQKNIHIITSDVQPSSSLAVLQGHEEEEVSSTSSDFISSLPAEPGFIIPTEASLKRDKMRRLKKKLGEGVPVDLVFPPVAYTDDDVQVGQEEENVLVDLPSSISSKSPRVCARPRSILVISPSSSLEPASPSSTMTSAPSVYTAESWNSTTPLNPRNVKRQSLRVRFSLSHEVHHQSPRKSSFVDLKPLPPLPHSTSMPNLPDSEITQLPLTPTFGSASGSPLESPEIEAEEYYQSSLLGDTYAYESPDEHGDDGSETFKGLRRLWIAQ